MKSHKINKITMTRYLFKLINANLRCAKECNLVDCYPHSKKTRKYDDDYPTLCQSEADYYEDIFEDLDILYFVDPRIPVQDISMMVTNLQNTSILIQGDEPKSHQKSITHLIKLNLKFMKQKHLIK